MWWLQQRKAMPIITSLGRGLHTNRGGSGLYTKSDAVKGSQPTPSQAERSADAGDINQRWFGLDQATKQAWQAVAGSAGSGRRLYSAVNRHRWHTQQAFSATPPPYDGPAELLPGVSASAIDNPPGIDGVAVTTNAIPSSYAGTVDVDLFKPKGSGVLGPAGSARWLPQGPFFFPGYEADGLQIWGQVRYWGTNFYAYQSARPPVGAVVSVRYTPISPNGYPSAALVISVVVEPYTP
jgi:hypothetical protein